MNKIGAASLAKLAGCEPELQRLVREVYATCPFDLTVLCGHRGEADQEAAFARGTSKVHYPNSKHNSYPSRAVDLAPFPVKWSDTAKFEELRAHVKACADRLGIKIRHISWDLPHTELA